LYGIWFNVVDSAGYCIHYKEQPKNCDEKCKVLAVGKLFGGDLNYQPWNVIGHLIPGLFLVLWTPKKVELFVAAALISSVVMDSPLWGVVRIDGHALPLWYLNQTNQTKVKATESTLNMENLIKTHPAQNNTEKKEPYNNTCDISKWIPFYYNPVGTYGVWQIHGSVTAAVIFWSLIGRSLAAGLLIWWQAKQEKEGNEFSLPNWILGKGTKPSRQ
jgi:hypothetical protein